MNRKAVLLSVLFWQTVCFAAERNSAISPMAFEELPLGSVRAEGWLLKNLEAQRDGISANLDETYPQVMGPRNGWLGGDGDQWERGPYWIDGLLPLAYVLDDEALKAKVKPWVEWALASQTPDGNFGPRTDYPAEEGLQRDKALDWWPRMVVLKILQQHYNATGDARVLPFMDRYFRYQLATLPETPLGHWTFWAEYRQADEMNIVLWLYRKTGEKYLLELADLLHSQGFDYVKYFEEEGISRPASIHCVNLAQGLKEPVIYWQRSGDQRLLDAQDKLFRDLPRFIGYPTGMFGGDEALRDDDPTRGSELCSAVEFMYSLEEMFKITGNPFYADYIERIAFNALTAQITPDFRLHQYFQQVNQISISYGHHDFDVSNQQTSNLFGFLTGYPCCLSNLHQGWPKFTQNLWLKSADGGLAVMAYAPCRVSAKLNGAKVSIREVTDYPHSDKIRLELSITAGAAGPGSQEALSFPLHLRIPAWTSSPSVSVNGIAVNGAVAGRITTLEREWKNGDVVELEFPMHISVSRWHQNAASVERGPLVYALPLDGKWKKGKVKDGVRKGQEYWEVTTKSAWNYGIPAYAVLDPEKYFTLLPDGSIQVPAALLYDWKEYNGNCGPMSCSVVKARGTGKYPDRSASDIEYLKLIPYGTTVLRIGEFPVLNVRQ